jgi:anti-sigma-K factor RskA
MSGPNLQELMLLYLADALEEREHALVKSRLAAGDREAVEALREARELFASLPVALDPVEPGPEVFDALMRQAEAGQLRGDVSAAPPKTRRPAETHRPAPAAPAPPATRSGGWVFTLAAAAGFAIAASAVVFFLARWDAQSQLQRVQDEAADLRRQVQAQADRLDAQSGQIDAQREQLAAQDGVITEQAEQIRAQGDRLADQGAQLERVAFSVQAQRAVTDELRTLFANQRNDLMVLMRREEEVSRVLSLLSAPRLEAYVLAGTDSAPDAAGRMFFDPQTGRLRLTVDGLDPAEAGRTYQAWFVLDDGAGAPVSLGVFNTNNDGEVVFEATLDATPDQIALAAVSVEPAGGVPAPTGAIVIAGGAQ